MTTDWVDDYSTMRLEELFVIILAKCKDEASMLKMRLLMRRLMMQSARGMLSRARKTNAEKIEEWIAKWAQGDSWNTRVVNGLEGCTWLLCDGVQPQVLAEAIRQEFPVEEVIANAL